MRRFIRAGVLILVCAVPPAAVARAQPPDRVLIEVQNAPPGGTAEIFVRGATTDHTFVGTSAGSIASDFMSEGKPVDVAIDRCGDQVSVTVVGDGDLFPGEPENCDRRIVENVPWGGGGRLVIDARRGTVVSVPAAAVSSPTAPTAPGGITIGTRPEVQAASQAVLDALRAEPATGTGVAATTAAVRELAYIPDGSLGTWVTRFADRLSEMGQGGANNTTLEAMQILLETVFRPFQLQPRSSNAGAAASAAPLSMREERGFSLTVSENYVRPSRQPGIQSASPTASRYVNLAGRFVNPGGPLMTPRPDRTWFYSVSTGRSIGLSTGVDNDSMVITDLLCLRRK
jgi:hypothetical protein